MSRLAGFDVALWSSFLRPKPTKAPAFSASTLRLRRRPPTKTARCQNLHPDPSGQHEPARRAAAFPAMVFSVIPTELCPIGSHPILRQNEGPLDIDINDGLP